MMPAEHSLPGWAVAGLVVIYAVGVAVVGFAFLITSAGFMASDACFAPFDLCERWINLTVLALLPLPALVAVVGGVVALRARSPRTKLAAVISVPVGAAILLLISIAVIDAVSARVTG
jgi:hypothetical protein